MGPVPVMRGLLVQPRATVQDDGSKRAGDRAGSRRQAPGTQRLPAHPIMTEPSDTGTQVQSAAQRAALAAHRAASGERGGYPTACVTTSRWPFITILLSAPRYALADGTTVSG